MNRKIVPVLLVLTVAALIGIPQVFALSSYVTAFQKVYTGGSCGTCHVDPAGGGTLTDYGSKFAAQSNHKTDPVAALNAIGPAPGTSPLTTPTPAPTLAPTPAPTPAPTLAPTSSEHIKEHTEDHDEDHAEDHDED